MPSFKAVLVEHGYSAVQLEREIIEAGGGEFIDADKLPVDQALALAAEADAVMLRRIEVPAATIRMLRRCRFLLRYGVGVDNVDLAAATQAGIIVGHVPVYCQDEVSTHAIALLLAAARRLMPTDQKMRGGAWDVHRSDPIHRLAGKTVGLIGLGTIGQAVARKLQYWNLHLVGCDPFIEPEIASQLGVQLVSLQELLRSSDYVSLHVPLLPETRHLISDETLALMKPGAVLVNTARGSVVDGSAVLRALDSGRLRCAALDVFEQEPLSEDSPLRRHPGLILTDHVGWYSEESQAELQQRAAREVVRVCTGGLPEAIANPEVLERLGRASEWQPNHLARWQRMRALRLAQSNPSAGQ